MTLDRRPDGLDDDTVAALGKLSEAMEWIERARGRLYDFHQMSGHADLLVGQAVEALRDAGHDDQADELDRELVGRNVVEGRWTFQLVEEYDADYWSVARALASGVETALANGVPHIFEAEMKAARITPGHPSHRPTPPRPGAGTMQPSGDAPTNGADGADEAGGSDGADGAESHDRGDRPA